jgi:hypothetical protein
MDKVEKDEIKDYVFGFECSVGWENLEKTNDENRRFCHRCNKNVYFVETQTELNKIAVKGNCVAFSNPNLSSVNITPVLGGYILPPVSHFAECKVCKKQLDKKSVDFVGDLCPECQKIGARTKKSWWQFWK